VIDVTKLSMFKRLACVFVIFSLFLLATAGLSSAASMPEFERFSPISAALIGPTSVAVDGMDNLYVAESSGNRVLVFNRDGGYVKTIGGVEKPVSVAVSKEGLVYVGSRSLGSVSVFDVHSQRLFKLGSGDGEFSQPNGIAVDSAGNAYVADSGSDTVKVYDSQGKIKFTIGKNSVGEEQFNFPVSIAIDDEAGEVYVSDLPILQSDTGVYEGARIQVFDTAGNLKRGFGTYGVDKGSLVKPLGITLDDEGRLYASDSYKNIVSVFDQQGAYIGDIYDIENPMRTPLGLVFSKNSGRLYVTSLNTVKIEIFGIDLKLITASAGSGGRISPSGAVYVRSGRDQEFIVAANHNFLVEDVLVDGVSVGPVAKYMFTRVFESHSIEARFSPKPVETKPAPSKTTGEMSHLTGNTDSQAAAAKPDSTSSGQRSQILLLVLIMIISGAALLKRDSLMRLIERKK